MKTRTLIFTTFVFFIYTFSSSAQCANPANIFSFTYNGNDYEVVKENKTWVEAAACAVERGGYLTRIDDVSEQNAIYDNVQNNAGIDNSNTIAPDGGGASYVWLGGNDMATEGAWIWDGDNDGSGDQFWQGTSSGNPVGGLYNNWGNEPDDWNGQDGLGLALTQWPIGSGSLGSASQWNDIDETNTLYYVIEYNGSSSAVNDIGFSTSIVVYPNPVSEYLYLNNKSNETILYISLYSQIGTLVVKKEYSKEVFEKLDVSKLKTGIYILEFESLSGKVGRKSIVIK